MGVIATLLLSLAPPAQEETPWLEEFRTRTLASEWEASPPPLEDLPQMWDTASLKEKGRFCAAAARGLKGSKSCLEFALLGLSLKPIPPAAWDAAQTCKIDARLETVLAELATDLEHSQSALKAALKQGIFPFPSKPNWITNLSPKEKAIVAVDAGHLLDGGWIPSSALAESLTALPMLRSRLLGLLAGRDIGEEVEHLRTLDTTTWAAEERVALNLLLLDNGVAITQKQQQQLLTTLFSNAIPSATRDTLANRALLHADLFAEEVRIINFAAPGYFDWLMKAPESAAYGPLLEYALDTSFPPAKRGKVALRLMRAWGERAADDLLPLVKPRQHIGILRSMFAGMRNFAQTRHAPALLAAEPGESSNLEDLWIEAYASALPLDALFPLMQRAAAVGNRGLIHRLGRNAWEKGGHQELLSIFWEWTDAPKAAVWQAALRLLSELLTPTEVVAELRARFDSEESPRGRLTRVEQARNLRTPEALSLYCHWLASSEGLAHPESATMAAILFEEESAREMFQTWWNRREDLRSNQVAAAAICLAPINEEARRLVWEILPAQTPPAQQAWVVSLSKNPQPGDAQQCADLIRDNKTTAQVKKVGAVGLVRNLPESSELFREILLELLSNPGAAPESARQMVLGGIHFGDDDIRNWVRKQIEGLAVSHPLRPRLASSVIRARTSSPRTDEVPADLTITQKGLMLGFSQQPPSSTAPEESNAKNLPGSEDFALHLGVLGAHGEVADASLAQWLAAGPRPALLHPDRLWILAQNKSSLPVSAAAATEILQRFEAPSSWRLTTKFPQPKKLPLDFELEAAEMFSALEERITGNDISPGTVDTLANARARFPADRRAFDLSGWWALSHGRTNDARGFFRSSMRRSGLLPAIQREPRLGLAACDQLENPVSSALEDEIKIHDTRELLANRIFGETKVRLQNHLKE